MSFNSLSDLRQNRGNFDSLMKEVEKISNPSQGGGNREDDRFWNHHCTEPPLHGTTDFRFLSVN